jgi:predicted MPP superfamily phosphohydrolase/uncharacterized membrane protein YqaE (UPF0057 family)
MERWLIFGFFALVAEWYTYQAVKTSFKNKWIIRTYLLFSAIAAVFLIFSFTQFQSNSGQTHQTLITIGLFLLIYIPKMLIAIFLFLEDIVRVFYGGIRKIRSEKETPFLPSRRKFISQTSLAISAIPFSSFIYGMVKGRYNYKVIRQQIFFNDLPEEFDGFTLMQLSDIHCGSFDNPEKIQYGIDLINQQDFDVLLFTGDLVNNFAAETEKWIGPFAGIKTPKYGKFSILGNHDYGEYTRWDSEVEKQKNFEGIKAAHPKMGFQLLNNEKVELTKGNSKIHIVGVENWGKGRFSKKGDLNKASEGIPAEDFKILLSHDPSHWDLETLNHPKNFQLTLSGHTHGMQFGIEIPNYFKWSPVQYMYERWAGLYQEMGKYLYVNRGFGYHAYPGRVGIWPEITIIELKKKG